MLDKKFLDRIILSENELGQLIMTKGELLDSYMQKLDDIEKIYLNKNELYSFIENLTKNIKIKAQKISFWSISLTKEENCNLTENSNEFIASAISNIFRNPNISKNSETLDISIIKEKCLNFVKNNEIIQLAIGWGQPKRIAGGFKAQGPNADFAELIALSSHLLIITSIENIYSKGAFLTLLSGGSRFYESYFTKKELSDLYDEERRILIRLLGASNKINIKQYEEIFNAQNEINKLRETLFNEALEGLDDNIVKQYLKNISLNIDWNNIFLIDKNSLAFLPHGLSLSIEAINYIKLLKNNELNKLIRYSLICMFNEKLIEKYEIELGLNFREIYYFMKNISFISTKKYIATHYKDKSCQTNAIISHINSEVIRLTVHQKKDRDDIPAVYTLGRKAKNKLAQHTSLMIDKNNDMIFCSTIEALILGGTPVYATKNLNLGNRIEQPLFYTMNKKLNLHNTI